MAQAAALAEPALLALGVQPQLLHADMVNLPNVHTEATAQRETEDVQPPTVPQQAPVYV